MTQHQKPESDHGLSPHESTEQQRASVAPEALNVAPSPSRTRHAARRHAPESSAERTEAVPNLLDAPPHRVLGGHPRRLVPSSRQRLQHGRAIVGPSWATPSTTHTLFPHDPCSSLTEMACAPTQSTTNAVDGGRSAKLLNASTAASRSAGPVDDVEPGVGVHGRADLADFSRLRGLLERSLHFAGSEPA